MVGPPDQTETALVEAARRELDTIGDQRAPIVVVVRDREPPPPVGPPASPSPQLPSALRLGWIDAVVVVGAIILMCVRSTEAGMWLLTFWFGPRGLDQVRRQQVPPTNDNGAPR